MYTPTASVSDGVKLAPVDSWTVDISLKLLRIHWKVASGRVEEQVSVMGFPYCMVWTWAGTVNVPSVFV